eukprot:TRINITY_DN17889_c2_g1_i2.p2 TRINITY_DN17889_c2_g1~~TRINITY_DN17889_c2_g1_i2.p2  ORF type:complete len:252 (+),score=17.93 TRINITY_DN17889_c2_g1_i2:2-757(+)
MEMQRRTPASTNSLLRKEQYVSIFVTVQLFGEDDGSGIRVPDFRRIMVDREFTAPALSSGYFWGRPIQPVIPKAAEALNGADATCVPGTTILGPDNCNNCTCPALGIRALAHACTRKLCDVTMLLGPAAIPTTAAKPDDGAARPWATSTLTCNPETEIGHPDRCNFCKCPSSGKFADTTDCTDHKIDSFICKARRKSTTHCLPGTRFFQKDGCTNCVCANGGFKSASKVCEDRCQDDYYDDYGERILEVLV